MNRGKSMSLPQSAKPAPDFPGNMDFDSRSHKKKKKNLLMSLSK